ncbi:MAG: hypothetical protein JNL70_23840 [Saprospiraceae bacterium]|nr:hypothetical protein [Saprospiraceae bacterium]
MKKSNLVLIPMCIATAIFMMQCLNKNKAVTHTENKNPAMITHKEAVDTLLKDSTAPVKPLIFKELDAKSALAFFQKTRLDSLFVEEYNYPDNGFYGDDRYRIEFLFTEAKQDAKDPSVYHIKGKNRHKKVITPFEGTIKFNKIRTFTDPNIDTAEVGAMDMTKLYATEGVFELAEADPKSSYSGLFKGTVKMEFSIGEDNRPSLWFYSVANLPSGGGGYRFDGTWTSFTKPDMVKPVVWAADLFRFANDILKDFSMGEREVEINEKYHKLGWDNFWENDEWWNEAAKPKM